MLASYLVAMGAMTGVVLLWFGVQQLSRAFHRRHPEALPALESMGCSHCASAGSCTERDEIKERCRG